jgi:hypothetical protein
MDFFVLFAWQMKFWQFQEPRLWHGKRFTLHWDFPGAWLVLVYYHNGEKKPWYRPTERPYRFRRWFLKKGKDRFQNIAAFHRPEIRLFVFSGFSPIPEKMIVPMEVGILRVREPEAEPSLPQMQPSTPTVHSLIPQVFGAEQDIKICLPALHFKNIKPPGEVQEKLLNELRAFQIHHQNQTSAL